MERDANDNLGNIGGSMGAGENGTTGGAGTTGGSGFGTSGDMSGSTGYGSSGMGASAAGSTGTGGSASGMGPEGNVTDRARELAGTAQERLADMGGTLREQAGTAKNRLADALEAGARKLGANDGQLAGAAGTGSVAMDAGLTNRVAGGMKTSADWLRDADIDGMREGIENQVRTNPGRTLLIAAGLGYLIGKAFRR
ncbi:MAG TPA: hypothetical protein VGD77_08800 [Gemmatimonadaceae bacterium]